MYHKTTSADTFSVIETRLVWTRLGNLKPNSQHIVYVTAIGAKGVSFPSETLVAWTDPALPAFVDVRFLYNYLLYSFFVFFFLKRMQSMQYFFVLFYF